MATVERGSYHRVRLTDGSRLLYFVSVSPNLFDVLGVGPLADSTDRGGDPAVVLTARGADRIGITAHAGVGGLIRLQEGRGLRISGLLPQSFLVPRRGFTLVDGFRIIPPDAVASVRVRNGRPTEGSGYLVARLQPGVTANQVIASLSRTAPSGAFISVAVSSLSEHLTGRLEREALVALASGFFILLICAANVRISSWSE